MAVIEKQGEANPFPIEAVATFGEALRSADGLQYVREITGLLEAYLSAFPDSQKRYGGALGLVGGHGSGKTHMLSLLADRGSELAEAGATVLYAKADTASLSDLYHQLVSQLSRQRVVMLIRAADRETARELVTRGRATESLETRMESPQDLQTLYAEENLEQVEISRLTEERLVQAVQPTVGNGNLSEEVPRVFPETLLRVDDPNIGEKAYAWFRGDSVVDLHELGLEVPLRQLRADISGTAADDLAAINALETLAALHLIAGIPLVLLLDQLEVAVRSDQIHAETLFSLIKKLIENLGRQNALLFMAAAEDFWDALRRDVVPRMRSPAPFRVGSLSDIETKLFLDAYTAGKPGFGEEAIAKLRDLTGGNLRELLRTAYYAYKRTGGQLQNVSRELLEESAHESGTMVDRRRLALEIADSVLSELGGVEQDLVSKEGARIDRVTLREGRPVCALLVITPTDRLSEIDSARRVGASVAYALDQLGAPLIVVSVGYSSEEVHAMLAETSSLIVFNELEFAPTLRSELIIITNADDSSVSEETEDGSDVYQLLQGIAQRLDGLELEREDATRAVQSRIEEGAQELARSERDARQAKTRWELQEQFNEVEEALRDNQPVRERELIRSALIANEIQLKLDNLDELGGLYLDLVSEALLWRGGPDEELQDMLDRRAHVLRGLQREVRRKDGVLDSPVRVSIAAGIGSFVLGNLFSLSIVPVSESLLERLSTVLAAAALIGAIVSAASFAFLTFRRRSRLSHWTHWPA